MSQLDIASLHLRDELRSAWRRIRARGWRAGIEVGLLGIAFAANAVVFAAADTFVFRTLPYRHSDKLVVIERVDRSVSDYIWPEALRRWRAQSDLFAGVHAHAGPVPGYLAIGDTAEPVRGERVTPGLLEMLGVVPKWGRPFVAADSPAHAAPVAIVGETLARRLFGDPSSAIGQILSTGSDTVTVVGVMPASFRFPTGTEEFWRPLDLDSWPATTAIRNVARLAPGRTLDSAVQEVVRLRNTIASAIDQRFRHQEMRLRSMADVRGNPKAAGLFVLLLGAAGCLLLIACANLASLELAAASRRTKEYALQLALGAGTASLARAALLEMAALLGVAAAIGVLLTSWGVQFFETQLTATMRATLTNPVDIDVRVIVYGLIAAVGTWLLTAAPSLWRMSRVSVIDGLRNDTRTTLGSPRTVQARQALVLTQVALTTTLLVTAFVFLRGYVREMQIDKGFDAFEHSNCRSGAGHRCNTSWGRPRHGDSRQDARDALDRSGCTDEHAGPVDANRSRWSASHRGARIESGMGHDPHAARRSRIFRDDGYQHCRRPRVRLISAGRADPRR